MAKTNLPPLPWCNDASVIEAGCDEAGRGCLAGPVTAAAVILPPGFTHPWLNDSKKLTERRRDELRAIIEREAVAWAVAMVDNEEIDRINILNASILAMHRALDALSVRPEAVIVDGNRFKPYRDLPWTTFVKGDGRFGNIAAASILAKTHRDELMKTLDGPYAFGCTHRARASARAPLSGMGHHRRPLPLSAASCRPPAPRPSIPG